MRTLRALTIIAVVGLMSIVNRPPAQASSQYITIDVPGAVCIGPATGTTVYGVNPLLDLVGNYSDAQGVSHGFLLRGHALTTIDPPGSVFTIATGIAPDGEIVGAYVDAAGNFHGFLLSGGKYTTVDVPNSQGMIPFAIDPQGDIAGQYFDSIGSDDHGFIRLANGAYTRFDAPGAALGTSASGIIPSGETTGWYFDASGTPGGFIREPNGRFTTFEAPGAAWTYPNGINARGDVIGGWGKTATDFVHGFLRTPDGRFTSFDDPAFQPDPALAPGALDQGTSPHGINAEGDIVGKYTDANGCYHGFVRIHG